MKPKRLQCRRTKGWTKPPNSVYVGRPTKWGNPYRATTDSSFMQGRAVVLYEQFLRGTKEGIELCAAARKELRGKHLLCWCKPCKPCHADVLLEIANKDD